MKPKKEIARYKLDTCLTCGRKQAKTVAGRCIEAPYCYERHRKDVREALKAQRGISTETKVNKPINKISDKQGKLNAAYSVLRKQFLKDNKYCKAVLGDCQFHANQVHHKKGRGEFMLDTTTWLPVCMSCHQWIEINPAKAKLLGLSEDRL